MINHRLFDHYGIDTEKNLGISRRCPKPFDTLLIDKLGGCYACECESWLPQSIGNLQIMELDDILCSPVRNHLKDSILDGTYRYCNQKQCSYLRSGKVGNRTPEKIENLRLAIDDSCNLRCPSCRTSLIFHKDGGMVERGKKLSDKINSWLLRQDHDLKVHIGSNGDPFASYVYRHFMKHTPRKNNIKYSLLTNGLMFSEFHVGVPNIVDNLTELGLSIDGATKHTYEKLRLGGKWEKIIENIEQMSALKAKRKFRWAWHVVVQEDNWFEMPQMVELGHRYGVDRIYFNRIQDWNTGLDFQKQIFHTKKEFKELVKHIETDKLAMTYSLS